MYFLTNLRELLWSTFKSFSPVLDIFSKFKLQHWKDEYVNFPSNRKTLTNNLVTFGQETDDCVVPGRKRRHTTKIHVQPTAISRRKYKHGGKGTSTKGRRPKERPSTSQNFVVDEEEVVYQSLKTKKQKVAKKLFEICCGLRKKSL